MCYTMWYHIHNINREPCTTNTICNSSKLPSAVSLRKASEMMREFDQDLLGVWV